MFVKNSNLHIRRFEFKYLVHERNLDKIRNSIKHFVELDENVKDFRSKTYHVKSIYYDDPKYSSYYEKLAGLKRRTKLRIRGYEVELKNSSTVFLEVKRKDDVIVFKDRQKLSFKEVKRFIEGANYRSRDCLIEKSFLDIFARKHLDTVVVDYDREAYFDKVNSSFRITFDRNIMTSKSFGLGIESIFKRKLIPEYSILELKFNRTMPAWFGVVIKTFNLERIAFSKYCISLEACGIVRRSDTAYSSWI